MGSAWSDVLPLSVLNLTSVEFLLLPTARVTRARGECFLEFNSGGR